MHTSSHFFLTLLLTLLPAVGFAQDKSEGLDLTDDSGKGLDLSEPEIPEAFRPSLAFVGVVSGDEKPSDTVLSRGRMCETDGLKLAQSGKLFSQIVDPSQTRLKLGAQADALLKCRDYSCMGELAKKLGVLRLVLSEVKKRDASTVLTIYGFDATRPSLLKGTVESSENREKQMLSGLTGMGGRSQSQRDRDFVKKAMQGYTQLFDQLSTPLGKLTVDCIDSTAVTTANDVSIGTGTFDAFLPAGSYRIKVNAPGSLEFEQKVVLDPAKSVVVKVTLIAKPLDMMTTKSGAPKKAAPPFYAKPSFYVVLAGLATLGVAAGFAASSQSVIPKAKDANQDGVFDITRQEAVNAKTQATIATALYAVGGAVTAGGAIWFFVTPTRWKSQSTQEPKDDMGATVGIAGVF